MDKKRKCQRIIRILLRWRNVIIVVLVPLLLLPVAKAGEPKVARCAYAVLVIGIFWVTEAMPLPVTSLLPVLLFPILGVVPVTVVCASYFKETLMLFMGSLIVAVGVERWGLHRRIALRALTLVGPEPKMLMLGLMLPCWFLSMWMSNTATTAMMVPILSAILQQIRESRNTEANDISPNTNAVNTDHKGMEMESLTADNNDSDPEANTKLCRTTDNDEDFNRLAKTFALCTAFAANIGGVATLTGTPPNIVFKGVAEKIFGKAKLDSGVTFANWMIVGFPLSLICLVFTWIWLQIYYSGKRCLTICSKKKNAYENVRKHLLSEYSKLGPMTFAEVSVLVVFTLLALLWVTRKPEFVPGWGSLFPPKYVGDSCPAILMAVLLFVLPSTPPDLKALCRQGNDETQEENNSDENNSAKLVPLLNWEIVNEKLSWGVIILMGGGFALADACSESGLSDAISKQLQILDSMPPIAVALILAFIVAGATNITSNSATATLFLPIVGKLAVQLEIHPLYFMIPCAIAASFAFLLPVGTPPNAIVFSTGYLTVRDMLTAGSVVNLVTVLFTIVAMNLWIVPFYKLDVFPEEFRTQTLGNVSSIPVATESGLFFYNTSLSI